MIDIPSFEKENSCVHMLVRKARRDKGFKTLIGSARNKREANLILWKHGLASQTINRVSRLLTSDCFFRGAALKPNRQDPPQPSIPTIAKAWPTILQHQRQHIAKLSTPVPPNKKTTNNQQKWVVFTPTERVSLPPPSPTLGPAPPGSFSSQFHEIILGEKKGRNY